MRFTEFFFLFTVTDVEVVALVVVADAVIPVAVDMDHSIRTGVKALGMMIFLAAAAVTTTTLSDSVMDGGGMSMSEMQQIQAVGITGNHNFRYSTGSTGSGGSSCSFRRLPLAIFVLTLIFQEAEKCILDKQILRVKNKILLGIEVGQLQWSATLSKKSTSAPL